MNSKQFNIVIVDDSPTMLEKISSMLNKTNYKIFKAHSGMECLRIIGNNPIDLILMDVIMENFDGYETARVIRNNPDFTNIPIIFMTAYDPDNKMMDFAYKHGGIDYLLKPFTEKEILRYITLYERFIEREREINKELNQLNSQLESAIHDKEMMNKELQDALEIRHKMFAIISHDLKNPISSFKLLLQEYNENFDSLDISDFKELMGILLKSSQELFNLMQDLLMWSNFQQNKMKFIPETFDINFIVKRIIENFNLQAQNKSITIINNVPEGTNVIGDPALLNLVIKNLISNAIKFTNEGGYITIFSEEFRNNNQVEISVSDTGVGIPKEKINKIFNLSLKDSTLGTNNETGTGLGMPLIYDAIKLHNSSIKVESQEGKGTTFSFILPKPEEEIEIIL